MKTEILNGLGTMTAIAIKNRADTLEVAAKMDPAVGKARGFLLLDYGRILVNTDPEFATEADAESHMREVIAACVEWGNAGMPSLG